MNTPAWTKALKVCADPQRARHFLELLASTPAGKALAAFSAEQATALSALFAGSQALTNLLIKHPQWIEWFEPERLKFPRRKQGLRQEVTGELMLLLEQRNYAAALARVREFKQRELLRIGARDLARLGPLPEILQELSDVADVSLDCIWRVCRSQLTERYGQPWHQDASGRWQETAACVLGMGKLGGQELNYSSDVDVLLVYTEEGDVYVRAPLASESEKQGRRRTRARVEAPRPLMPNHAFFKRLAEAFVAEVTRLAPEGALYRIDFRLRPEGEGAPLSRSLASYENYYAQWGQTWERMMLIKARGVAGDEMLAAEFLEMIQPFRYPRSLNEGVLGEVGAMKDRIENEVVKPGELERNVKLGRGGIREIEFIAQSMQLMHAGRQPFLQGAQTLPCLQKLVQYELLSPEDSLLLRDAYVFLREVEHRLQMEDNRQTHTIPTGPHAQLRLARLLGFHHVRDFEAARQQHTANVRRIFDRVLKVEVPRPGAQSSLPRQFEGAESQWKRILTEHAFKDIDKAYRVLREFVEGPGFVHVSPRTSELALRLLPRFFALCPGPGTHGESPKSKLQSPAEVSSVKCQVSSPESEVGKPKSAEVQSLKPSTTTPTSESSSPRAKDGQREARVPLSDPDRVVTRLDNFISAYGARSTLFELWAHNPAIFELLVLLFDRSEFLAELSIRTPDLVDELVTSGRLRQRKSAEETLEDLRHGLRDADQSLWLRRYHQAELMRIGLRDILGLADFEQYLSELSALADACLRYALEVVLRQHRLKAPPFVIIGLGKLGGSEIDYGSDLDIVFVANSKARNLLRLSRLALEVMELVSRRTEQGLVFHTDARLRPDGEKGLLVNTVKAYEDYYRHRAQLWEIQTLTRTRAVAGDSTIGQQFQSLAAALTNFARPSLPLASYATDWKQRIHRMRMRIEKERTPRGQDELAIKTGAGGLMDAEFVAQALCLEHGWQQANTLKALQQGRAVAVLPGADKLIMNYRQLRRVEGILRRWSYEGETVLPNDPAPYYRVSVRCGFPTPEAFSRSLRSWRAAIRGVYRKMFA